MAHQITTQERKRRDFLRRRGLATGAVYEARLIRARRKELKRVLALARDYDDPQMVAPTITKWLDESSYMTKWWEGLYITAGLPMAQSTARELSQAKAAAEDAIWTATLKRYARTRAGENIVLVTGTWKDTLVSIISGVLLNEPTIGVEALTTQVFRRYTGEFERWMARRIAQTETMIGMAEASDAAAQTLDVQFTKQWCISGLGNTRETHELMDGNEVDQDEPFILPDCQMMYPHDCGMGAPASEIINCACDCIRRPKGNEMRATEEVQAPEPELDPEEQRIQELMAEQDKNLPEATRRAIAKNNIDIEKKAGVTKGSPMDLEMADKMHANPDFQFGTPTGVNCATCVPTFVMRERGFDFTAKGMVQRSGSLNEKAATNPWQVWKNADGTKVKPSTFQEFMRAKEYKTMTSARYYEFFDQYCKEKGTYELVLNYKGKGGHATILRRLDDGKLVMIEPQSYWEWRGMTFDPKATIGSMKEKPDFRCGVMKLDDKILDPDWVGLFNVKK